MAVEYKRDLVARISQLEPQHEDFDFLSAQLIRTNKYLQDKENKGIPKKTDLTFREEAILDVLAQGIGGKESAHSLGISLKALREDGTSIHLKLGVKTTLEAVLKAAELGIINIEK